MYTPDFYGNKTEEQIKIDIEQEGFNPVRFDDKPGYRYPSHSHPETKLLAFLKGSMKVKMGTKEFNCVKGDRLIIQGNILHSATVGPDGCAFFWAEKLV